VITLGRGAVDRGCGASWQGGFFASVNLPATPSPSRADICPPGTTICTTTRSTGNIGQTVPCLSGLYRGVMNFFLTVLQTRHTFPETAARKRADLLKNHASPMGFAPVRDRMRVVPVQRIK